MRLDYRQKPEAISRLIELSTDAIIIWSPDEGIVFWNQGAEQLYGYSEEEALAFRGNRLLEPTFPIPADEVYRTLAAEGKWAGDVREVTRDAQVVIVSARYQSITLDGRQLIMAINRDVTSQHVIQSDILALNKRLVTTNRELDEFAYIATHDLKEPFRGIAINADILLQEKLPEKAATRVRRMGVLCQRIDLLLSDLLYFSRLGHAGTTCARIDPSNTITQVGDELRETLLEKSGVVTVETNLPGVFAEPSRIKVVFYNLIKNSLLYNDAETCSVDIGFLPDINQDGVVMRNAFYVRDNGIGIDAKNHTLIFQFSKRLNREEDYGFGTGAGLSIVKKIVESLGGEIAVSSQPGQGATFYFSLPLEMAGA